MPDRPDIGEMFRKATRQAIEASKDAVFKGWAPKVSSPVDLEAEPVKQDDFLAGYRLHRQVPSLMNSTLDERIAWWNLNPKPPEGVDPRKHKWIPRDWAEWDASGFRQDEEKDR